MRRNLDLLFDPNIIEAKECPYCGEKPDYVDSVEIYGKSYGMVYLCRPCDAYVGVHHKTSKVALGRLANKDLREAKKLAHSYFDPLWKEGIIGGRRNAYKWLSEQLGIPEQFTHIGMFDTDLCMEVVQHCNIKMKNT